MYKLNYVRNKLKKSSTFNAVSFHTKISIPTLYSIRKPNSKPHNATIEALFNHFQKVVK